MQKHTKDYLDFFEIQYDEKTGFCDPVECTIQGENCTGFMHEIHHIDKRGMGGNPDKSRENIENYIATCRNCHDEAEDEKFTMQELYNKQMSKILNFLQSKIDNIMQDVLLRIKEFFKKYGTVHHGKRAEYFKLDLLGQIFVFWNCRTGEITKLEGRNIFDKDLGFKGSLLKQYYCSHEQKFLCTPEELTELHDEIKLIYQLKPNEL